MIYTFIGGLLSLFLPFLPTTNSHFENIQLSGFQYIIGQGLELYFVLLLVLLLNYFTIGGQYRKYEKVIPVLMTITIIAAYGEILIKELLIGGVQRGTILLGTYSFGYFISLFIFLVFNLLVYIEIYKIRK